MSGKKRNRDSSGSKEHSPEPRARPNVSRSRASNSQSAKEPTLTAPAVKPSINPATQPSRAKIAEVPDRYLDPETDRKTAPVIAGNQKRGRDHKADSSRALKQQVIGSGAAVATRTRAAAELSGSVEGHPPLRAGVVAAPAGCLPTPILVPSAAPGDARNIMNPVLIPPTFPPSAIAAATIPPLVGTMSTSFPSPGLKAVAVVPGPALACSSLKLPAPALTSYLPTVQGASRPPALPAAAS
jgi:hypothetical protein